MGVTQGSWLEQLLRCFRGSHVCFIQSICSSVLQCSRQMFYRWEGMAVSTNCSPPELLCYIANIPCSACLSKEKPVDHTTICSVQTQVHRSNCLHCCFGGQSYKK